MPEAVHSTIPPKADSPRHQVPPSRRGSHRRKRLPNGKKRGVRKCHFCEEPKKVHYWMSPTSPVCITCYQKHIRVGLCASCGNLRKISKINEDGEPLCHTCYQQSRPEEICAICGDPGKIAARFDDGRGECNKCYQRRKRREKRAAEQAS